MKRFALVVPALLAANALAADADEGAIEWRHRATRSGVTLTANPLTAASRTAFFAARGFAAQAIHPYAAACGFSFGMHNGGTRALATRLADWRAIGADGRGVALRRPETWDAAWAGAGVSSPARIAFRWAQFQAENAFAPGDWIMGMATLEARPVAPFRIVARYRDEQGDHAIVLDRLACAD